MLSKLSALRLIATSGFLFLSVFLFSFSCEDHPEPPRIFPIINTLDIIRVNEDPSFKYSVQFTELGNQEIAEYGVVTYAGSANDNVTPTIPVVDQLKGRKYDFSGPTYMPPNLNVKGLTKSYDGPSGQIRLFYRAYARLANNFVVYGQVKFVDFFVAPQQQKIFPVVTTMVEPLGPDAMTFFVTYLETGNQPIVEYGVVFIDNKLPIGNFVPTINDEKYAFAKPVMLGKISEAVSKINAGIADNSVLYVRAYVKLQDGTIIYGNVAQTFS